jgi:predicted exporter
MTKYLCLFLNVFISPAVAALCVSHFGISALMSTIAGAAAYIAVGFLTRDLEI